MVSSKVYPNPLEGQATVEINSAKADQYQITLYNALGEQVRSIYNGSLEAGTQQIQWSTDDLTKGIYVLRIENQGQVQTIKLVKD